MNAVVRRSAVRRRLVARISSETRISSQRNDGEALISASRCILRRHVMKCVKCDGRLITVRVEDVDVDQCDRCGGIWFDAHELERVLGRGRGHLEALAKRGTPRPDDDARRGHCPRCGGDGYLVQLASPKAKIHVDT